MGELKDTAKGLANEVAGNVKQAVGKHNSDKVLHDEGKKQERKGELQQAAGKIKGAVGDRI
jgi:uncharacterized protein YjbJ (UPF0337 family)